jgi:uncharacterized integral membrane protein
LGEQSTIDLSHQLENLMRTKSLLLITFTLLIAAFTVLNVDEFTRTSTLSLGFTTMQLPLGLIMLMLVAALLLIFLIFALYMRSVQLLENRKQSKELTSQRELADKAESSRFSQLRGYLESQALMCKNRETETIANLDRRMAQTEKHLLQRLEQSDNTNAAYWGQHDDALARNHLQPQP